MKRPPAPAKPIPTATYRLQFNREFTFNSASLVADYLRELGVSDCYASPILYAGPQSTHGYDICDFDQLNPSLGTFAEFERLVERLHALGMGLLLDMVPNHMSADPANPWWRDVLERGPASPYARWFDIDWEPRDPDLRGKVLLPVLEDHYATVLEAGKLHVAFERGWFNVRYYDRAFPLSPAAVRGQLSVLARSGATDPRTVAALTDLRKALETAEASSSGGAVAPDLPGVKQRLDALAASSRELRSSLQAHLEQLNGHADQPRSYDALHALLQNQHYHLADWRTGPERINYRRFFDITDLVSMRMELPEVFRASHEFVLRLVRQGKVNGLRIDHPDGLWDPKQYLERLRASAAGDARGREGVAEGGGVDRQPRDEPPDGTSGQPLYVVVEKILTGDELLPLDWPVAGTTGYDFLNRVNGLFVNGANREAFTALYNELTGCAEAFEGVVERGKKQVLSTSFRSELNALADGLAGIAARSRYGQDFTSSQLHSALFEVIAAFPVYRTYVCETTERITLREGAYVRQSLDTARAANPGLDPAVFDFVENLLLLSPPSDLDAAGRACCRQFVMKLQQLTSPVMAKGLEDTAFYDFNRLISLNEVGGDPNTFGTEPSAFHAHNSIKAERWPHSLLATATHDTKRGEDARARIDVLSEMPEPWHRAVLRWKELNGPRKIFVNGQPAPHPNDEYLLYQALVGAWPSDAAKPEVLGELRSRVSAYMLKAVREAKARTSWTSPNPAYEDATARFVENVLTRTPDNTFLPDFAEFQRTTAFFGKLNSLAQTLLKMTAPGVPDFYQGTELWDFNLVDPDNRRVVDYELRKRLLEDARDRWNAAALDRAEFLSRLLRESDNGQVKLWLIWRALGFRLGHRELFDRGGYTPIRVFGARDKHVVAFARTFAERAVVAIAPRLVFELAGGIEQWPLGEAVWADTTVDLSGLPCAGECRDVLTGEVQGRELGSDQLKLAKVLRQFPVALLTLN